MSNILNTIFRLLPVSLIGLLLNQKIIKNADVEMMFDGMIMLFIVVLFILAFVWTLYKDNKVYRMTQSKISYIPTSIGILFITSFFITNSVLAARDKSPILIQAGYDGGFNGAWFEFREDGTYKFINSGGIGATYFRGKYILKDSIITLDKSNIDNAIQSNLLAIRRTEMLDTTEQVVFQINSQHQVVDKEFKFRINIDKRKK